MIVPGRIFSHHRWVGMEVSECGSMSDRATPDGVLAFQSYPNHHLAPTRLRCKSSAWECSLSVELPTEMNIPQELIDKIIDGVWDGDDCPSHMATRAASLISRSWVERSQQHLFHDIKFSIFGPHFECWCDAVSPDPNGVSRHVQSLTIQAGGIVGQWIDKETLEHGLPFFGSFRNVRVLRVCNWDVESFPPETITRCFTSFAGSVRVLQWDPCPHISRESWTRIIMSFPLIDSLLLYPKHFPTGLLSDTPAGPTRKKLVLFGDSAAELFMWSGDHLWFQEIYIRCGFSTTPQTIISIVNGNADQLEVLSVVGIRRGQTFPVLFAWADSEFPLQRR